jgi:hypothetical protein
MALLQSKGLVLIASVALATAVASLAMNVYVITAPDPQDSDDLESRVTDLENRVDDLESRMDDLESRMDDVESRLSSLESRMDALEQRVSDLENGTTGGGTAPVIVLGPADAVGPDQWQVDVVGYSEITDLSSWEVVLLINETVVEIMSPLAPGTFGNITFVDLVGEGNLTVGDYFAITCVPSSHYEIVMAWRETHDARGSEDWYTP